MNKFIAHLSKTQGDRKMKQNKLEFISKTPGIGGALKSEPEDFVVEEIIADGTVLELDKIIKYEDGTGNFLHFILQKYNWSTAYAVREIAKRLNISHKRFSYGGMKDKRALTIQLVSASRLDRKEILGLRIKDISINGTWISDQKVDLGDLVGNRFTIRVRGACVDAEDRVEQTFGELEGKFPNYFGDQRFGTISRNTHLVGERIIRKDFEGAVMTFLCDYENENHEQARTARQDLLKTLDFKAALANFPKYLRFERTLLAHLAEHPMDHVGALKKLPGRFQLLFVHAFQSHLFNRLLSDRISEGKVEMEEGEYLCAVNGFGFPDIEKIDVDGWLCIKLLGFNSNPNEREKALFEELGISKKDFMIHKIPEISSKGSFRTAFAPLKDFSFQDNTFCFSLQPGSYATTALREFLEVEKL